MNPRADLSAVSAILAIRSSFLRLGDSDMAIRIGAGPIGWFEDDFSAFRNDIAREAHMISVARAGFDGICLNPSSARDVACVHATLARHGLAFLPPTHSITLMRRTAAEVFADLHRHVRAAHALGAGEMTVCEAGCLVMSDADWQRFGDRLTELAAMVAEANVRLVYRPRAGTVVTTAKDVDALMSVVGSKVGLLLEAEVLGQQTVDIARRHAGSIAIVAPGTAPDAVMAALPRFKGWTVLDEAAGQAPARVDHCRAIADQAIAA
jgi:inosose dehydratase